MMVSLLCKVAVGTAFYPVTSPSYENSESVLAWLEGFLGTNNPTAIKNLKVWGADNATS